MDPTHEIVLDGSAIKCTVCGLTSFNQNDVQHLFCGNCKQFHPIDRSKVSRETLAEGAERERKRKGQMPGNSFRIVQNGSLVGLLIECGSEDAAKTAYAEILNACKRDGSCQINIEGVPVEQGGFVLERGVNYGDKDGE